MNSAYAEKEREFVAGLAEDTGRDLAAWMTAIASSGHTERNDIIDWLRHQGFHFAWASWLERIHHNGGRLIYAGILPNEQHPANRAASTSETTEEPPSRTRPVRSVLQPPQPSGGDIQNLLSEAKGLRPLAEHILREVGRAVPATEFAAAGPLVTMSAPKPFAALYPGPKKLRLYANFGPAGTNRSKPAEAVNKGAPPFAEMLVLDDARSIDEDFRRLIRAAAAR
ncbi:hypothetical protein [Hyphomicrobium sp.]|jgi:hypothetical protein|uniref:hypothetical protein n=1 Tax=Hyphomicrobium sp. TaxID=82 RepID=UPI0035676D0D